MGNQMFFRYRAPLVRRIRYYKMFMNKKLFKDKMFSEICSNSRNVHSFVEAPQRLCSLKIELTELDMTDLIHLSTKVVATAAHEA